MFVLVAFCLVLFRRVDGVDTFQRGKNRVVIWASNRLQNADNRVGCGVIVARQPPLHPVLGQEAVAQSQPQLTSGPVAQHSLEIRCKEPSLGQTEGGWTVRAGAQVEEVGGRADDARTAHIVAHCQRNGERDPGVRGQFLPNVAVHIAYRRALKQQCAQHQLLGTAFGANHQHTKRIAGLDNPSAQSIAEGKDSNCQTDGRTHHQQGDKTLHSTAAQIAPGQAQVVEQEGTAETLAENW